MDTAAPATTAGTTVLSRYVLEDRIGGTDLAPVWRGTDTRLRRAVAIRLLPREDPRADAVRSRAQQAAAFTDRRAVPVLDVGLDEQSDLLVVVADWVPALGYGDYLAARGSELLAPHEAAAVALELSRCLAAAHAVGLTHGVLNPNSLLVTDSGEIRLRGLGIAGALAAAPDDLPAFAVAAQQDVNGCGAVLYLGLTGRWPAGAVDHVPGATRLSSGALPWPSRVVADVPPVLDEIAARALEGAALPKGRPAFADVASVAAALAAATEARPASTPAPRPAGPRVWVRVLGITLAVLLVAAIALVGVSLASGPVTRSAAPDTSPAAPGPSLTPGPSPSHAVTTGSGPIPIVAVKDLDPFGNGSEHPSQVPLAVDGNPATAWTTLRYRAADLSGKRGVGLLVDLGAPLPVSSVRLVLVGNNSSVKILAGDTAARAPKGYTVFGRANGAPTEVTIRSVEPVTTRYLAIWLTRLPPSGNKFQGGIGEITVLP